MGHPFLVQAPEIRNPSTEAAHFFSDNRVCWRLDRLECLKLISPGIDQARERFFSFQLTCINRNQTVAHICRQSVRLGTDNDVTVVEVVMDEVMQPKDV